MEINKIICGDSLTILKTLPDECVNMIMTSPPYFGLRNYGETGQIGLEPTFAEYLEKILKITAELKRVLKPEGSFWLNMGDSYASVGKIGGDFGQDGKITKGESGRSRIEKGMYPEKSLIGQPWRMALALIDQQGWILRADVNWIKQILIWKDNNKYTMGSVMPTSVKDRVNMASEHLFHFVKQQKYYFDMDAIRIPNQVLGVTDMRASGFVRSRELYLDSKYREEYSPQTKQSNVPRKTKLTSEEYKPKGAGQISYQKRLDQSGLRYKDAIDPKGKNLPNNWLIRFEPLPDSHFAAYPTALCEIPILASCPVGGIVFDPFMGAGSTAVAAKRLSRKYLGIELSAKYIKIAERRLSQDVLF